MYEWHGSRYLGAAHGLVGICQTLLLCPRTVRVSLSILRCFFTMPVSNCAGARAGLSGRWRTFMPLHSILSSCVSKRPSDSACMPGAMHTDPPQTDHVVAVALITSLSRAHMQVLEQIFDATGHGGLELVRTAVHALVGACFPSGNLPSSLDSESDRWVRSL